VRLVFLCFIMCCLSWCLFLHKLVLRADRLLLLLQRLGTAKRLGDR